MESSLGIPVAVWDGVAVDAVAVACGVPRVHAFAEVGSTMDVAHALARDDAPAGTLVLADRQVAGRGRGGHAWVTAPGDTLALSLVERPLDVAAVGVLSLRLGMRAARVLRRHAPDVQVKWPNDLMRPGGKVGGILVEARWRGARPDWVVVGVGVNLRAAPWPGSSALAADVTRVEVLEELVPALRAAAQAGGPLTATEVEEWRRGDWAAGRAVESPARGVVRGVTESGALMVDTPTGVVTCANGSLILAEA